MLCLLVSQYHLATTLPIEDKSFCYMEIKNLSLVPMLSECLGYLLGLESSPYFDHKS